MQSSERVLPKPNPEIGGGLRQRGRRLMQKCQATARTKPHLAYAPGAA